MKILFKTLLTAFVFGKTGLSGIEGIEEMGVNIT